MSKNRESELRQLEDRAMGGDIAATIRVVSLCRSQRAAAHQLLSCRQDNGEIHDAIAVDCFESAIDESAAVATDGMP